MLPAQFGYVDQTIHTAEVHESTKVNDRGDNTVTALTWLEVLQEVPALLFLGLFKPRTARKNNIVAVSVEFNNLRLNGLADVGL